jgi:hypothetical protein
LEVGVSLNVESSLDAVVGGGNGSESISRLIIMSRNGRDDSLSIPTRKSRFCQHSGDPKGNPVSAPLGVVVVDGEDDIFFYLLVEFFAMPRN